MRVRALLVMALLAYVALDLGCPLIPGAFSFDAASSVEAASSYRVRPPAVPTSAAAPTLLVRPHGGAQARTEMHGVSLAVAWRPHAIRDHVTAPEPPRSVDDD